MNINPLSTNPTRWSNTLKQFVKFGKLPTNCLSVFDHFVKLAFKGLILQIHIHWNIPFHGITFESEFRLFFLTGAGATAFNAFIKPLESDTTKTMKCPNYFNLPNIQCEGISFALFIVKFFVQWNVKLPYSNKNSKKKKKLLHCSANVRNNFGSFYRLNLSLTISLVSLIPVNIK